MTLKYKWTDPDLKAIKDLAKYIATSVELENNIAPHRLLDLVEAIYHRVWERPGYPSPLEEAKPHNLTNWGVEHRLTIEALAMAIAERLDDFNENGKNWMPYLPMAEQAFALHWENAGCWPPDRNKDGLHKLHVVAAPEPILMPWSAKRQSWWDAVNKRYWTPHEIKASYAGSED